MTMRDRLHRLVEELPEAEVSAAERYLEYLRLTGRDPVLCALLDAPEDDEAETEEERVAVAEAELDIQEGRVYSLEEVNRELGL
jgi:hypothetical protein